MKTYYIKYKDVEEPAEYHIWETTEDYTQERCVYSTGDIDEEDCSWYKCTLSKEDKKNYEITVLTKADLFLECL